MSDPVLANRRPKGFAGLLKRSRGAMFFAIYRFRAV